MTTTIPTSATELEEMLADGRVAAMFEGGKPSADFGDFIKAYANALQGKGTELAAQVREETQRVLAEYLKEHGASEVNRLDLSPANRAGATSALYNRQAPGAKVDALFDSPEAFLRASWYRNTSADAVKAQEQIQAIRNSYGSTIPSDGGFLIPETLRSNLLQVALETSIVRPRATVIPMDSLRVPLPVIDDTSHASSVYGGMIGYWTEEAGALTDTSATFSRVVLEARKLTGYSEVPNELFQDSVVSFASFLNQVWPRAIAYFEDVAFIDGSGVGEPLGVLNADAAVTVSRATGNEINWADVVKMYARMLPASLGSAVWLANINTFPQLAQMIISDTNGVASPALWLSNGQGIEGPPMTLLGRPVIFTEKVPALGTAGDLSFVDFGYYLVGDRQAMSLETSPHYKFKNDQTAVRIIERVDGRCWLNSALTPRNGSDTLSAVVKLG
ncbi:phage major capsid protein [Nonomuraea bangladeshensis]|uniref:phage major capsid protein n=1 Tax=Nonomuraea bangladeshensis TaxID=404385 RepID=UPI0031CE7367